MTDSQDHNSAGEERPAVPKKRSKTTRSLTSKDKAIVDHWIENPAKSKKTAYKEITGTSGVQADMSAQRFQNRTAVREYHNDQMEQQMERTHIRQDTVLNELAALALFDVRTLFDENGQMLPIQDWSFEAGHAISGFNIKEVVAPDGSLKGRDITFKLWDKVRALELLGKHLRLFVENPTDGTLKAKAEIMNQITELQMELQQRGLIETPSPDDRPEPRPDTVEDT